MKIILTSRPSEEVCQTELAELSYRAHQISIVLAFGVVDRGDIFLPHLLLQESEKLEKQVDDLTVDRNMYLEVI